MTVWEIVFWPVTTPVGGGIFMLTFLLSAIWCAVTRCGGGWSLLYYLISAAIIFPFLFVVAYAISGQPPSSAVGGLVMLGAPILVVPSGVGWMGGLLAGLLGRLMFANSNAKFSS